MNMKMNTKLKLYISVVILSAILMLSYCSIHKTIDNSLTKLDKKEKINKILKNSEFYFLDEKEKIEKYYKQAKIRKNEILNSKTNIIKSDKLVLGKTYTGTAYYISEKGADFNSGLTPENPIKTIKQLNRINLQKGDAVFFERGYTYRTPNEAIIVKPFVTYSAYGNGKKPVLTRARENSSKKEYWKLYHGGKNGEKIWQYTKEIGDVAGIILDDKDFAKRIYELPTKKGWLSLNLEKKEPHKGDRAKDDATANVEIQSLNKYKSIEETLTTDKSYVSRINIQEFKYPINVLNEKETGKLYLRYDKGNPAEYHNDIEIISIQNNEKRDLGGRILDSTEATDYVIDNLSFKYYSTSIMSGDIIKNNNVIIQNSTIEWGGNSLFKIKSDEPTNNYFLIGDGIYLIGRNTTFKNNYISNSGNSFVLEDFEGPKTKMGTFTIEENIVENCGQGFRLGLEKRKRTNSFDKISIKNNIILNSGTGLNNACFEEPVAIDLGWFKIQYSKEFDISNNIMIGSTMALMRIPPTKHVKMEIKNNTFVQERNGILLTEMEWNEDNVTWYMMKDIKD